MQIYSILSVLTALIVYVTTHCPPKENLPKSTNGKLLCARLYENTHTDVNLACRGSYFDVADGVTMPKMGSWRYRVSAVVVRKGCAIKLYSSVHFGGNSRTLRAGRHHDLRQYHRSFWIWKNWNDATASFRCHCI